MFWPHRQPAAVQIPYLQRVIQRCGNRPSTGSVSLPRQRPDYNGLPAWAALGRYSLIAASEMVHETRGELLVHDVDSGYHVLPCEFEPTVVAFGLRQRHLVSFAL